MRSDLRTTRRVHPVSSRSRNVRAGVRAPGGGEQRRRVENATTLALADQVWVQTGRAQPFVVGRDDDISISHEFGDVGERGGDVLRL